jgi:hypothetical protein
MAHVPMNLNNNFERQRKKVVNTLQKKKIKIYFRVKNILKTTVLNSS